MLKDCSYRTILIVDDEDLLRKTIVLSLKKYGFTIYEANGGRAAFEIIKTTKIDLVISDIRMPDGDGLDLLEKTRAHAPGLPTLIFITGFSSVTEEECLSRGARKVIVKPFGRHVLTRAVFEELGLDFHLWE